MILKKDTCFLQIIHKRRQPKVVVEETVTEDATFPEQVGQAITIKDGTVAHIGAGPYNGFIQGSCHDK